MEGGELNRKQDGFISSSMITILIGGLALGGLFIHASATGQELPLLPAIAVAVVNLLAAGKIVLDVKARKQRQQARSEAAPGDKPQ